MVKVAMNLNFTAKLVGNVRLQQLVLIEDFEGDDKLAFLLACQVHMTKLATP